MRGAIKLKECSGGTLWIEIDSISSVVLKHGMPSLVYDKSGNKFGVDTPPEQLCELLGLTAQNPVKEPKK